MTKEQILQQLSGLPIGTLERLRKYSELLIIPDEDLLSNVTMSQMVNKGMDIANVVFPEWTDRSPSDFGRFLLELIALYSEKDFWYINAFANEGLLNKMRSYSNAFVKASTMGYSPTLCESSGAAFSVTFSEGQQASYKTGDLIVSAGGYDFINKDPFDVMTSGTPITISLNLIEGKYNVVDDIFNGYNVTIRKPNVCIDTVKVYVDNIQYNRVKSFAHSDQNSQHFMVLPEEDGSATVFFGSNGFGVTPDVGKAVRLHYVTNNGSSGNIQMSASVISDSNPHRQATEATMLTESSGGTFGESLQSIKERAPYVFQHRWAAINEESAEKLLLSLKEVHSAKVVVTGRDVQYQVIPASGSEQLTQTERNAVKDTFEPCLLMGYNGVLSNTKYVDLLKRFNPGCTGLQIEVVLKPSYDVALTSDVIKNTISDYFNPMLEGGFGDTLSKAELDLKIKVKAPGVQSVSYKYLVGLIPYDMPDIKLSDTEVFKKIDVSTIKVVTNVY